VAGLTERRSVDGAAVGGGVPSLAPPVVVDASQGSLQQGAMEGEMRSHLFDGDPRGGHCSL
jgi:hypothetical protein